jgi:4-amino-4-deoxy-L-arabinose transferase-like glycosyltransferase
MSKPLAGTARLTTRLGRRRTLLLAAVVAGLFAAYLSVELSRNREPGFPLDDAWIHLTFARNLARGWGFAYNQGQPAAGSTAPLWTFVLAFFHLFTRNAAAMVVTAKLLGAALLFASAVFAFRIAVGNTGSERAGLVAGLAVATLGPLGWAMMSGMEVMLSTALTLAGLYYYLKFRTGRLSMLAWVLFGLAAWARPESLLLAVFAAIDSVVRRTALKQRPAFGRGFAVWLAFVLAWLGFNYALSGSVFPQTYLAKAGKTSLFSALAVGSLSQLKGLLTVGAPSYFIQFCLHLWRANPVLCLLVPFGLVGLLKATFRRRQDGSLMLPLVVLGYVPLIGFVSPSFGAAFQSGRYIGNVTALAAVVAVIGAACLWDWIRRRWVRIAAGALLLMAAFNAVTVSVATIRNTTRAESSINRMQVLLGQWLAANTPTGATVACQDVGAIGYFSGRHIFDLIGLVTKEMRGRPLDGENFMAFFRDYRPDYLVIFPAAFPGLRNAPFLGVVQYADVPDNTASLVDFTPSPKTLAGLLVLDLEVEPVPATTVVFRCNWDPLPPPAAKSR